jgi:ABC-2 type transport system permease protein
MKAFITLISPMLWSIKNDMIRANWTFYKRIFLYTGSSLLFIIFCTKLLQFGMVRLQNLPSNIFEILIIKGYSFIFLIVFAVQIINGIIFAINSFYQSRELEVVMISPVNRTPLFFSRLLETQLKASWMLAIFGLPLLVSAGIVLKAGLTFYAFSILLFIIFSSIPVNIGISAALFLSSFFYSRKLKKILLSTGVIAVIIITTLFRIYRPERFVSPELFANLTLFISELNTASHILLPNRWLSESVFGLVRYQGWFFLIFISLLILSSYLTAILSLIFFNKYHHNGWALLQEGGFVTHRKDTSDTGDKNILKKALGIHLFKKILAFLSPQRKVLFLKEILYQIRDVRNVHQYLILISLVIVYLFSISSLPLNWTDILYSLKLKYFTAFFNIGLISIILTALCTRIVSPSVLADKDSFWILRTSPVSPKQYIRAKYLFFFIPLILFGLILTIFSFYFIQINKAVLVLEILTVIFLCSSLVSTALMFGTIDLKKWIKEGAKEEIKTGNVLYMIVAIALIMLTLALEAVPTFLYFLKESEQAMFAGRTWLIIFGSTAIIILLNALTAYFSIGHAIKKLNEIEL